MFLYILESMYDQVNRGVCHLTHLLNKRVDLKVRGRLASALRWKIMYFLETMIFHNRLLVAYGLSVWSFPVKPQPKL